MKIDLSNDDGYLIAAAIRGPDFKGEADGVCYQAFSAVKAVFTARFRHICGVTYFGAEIRQGTDLTTFNEGVDAVEGQFCDIVTSFAEAGSMAEREAMWHVLSHLKRAFQILPEDEYGREIIALVNLIDAVCNLLDYFPTNKNDAAAWMRAAYANLVDVIHFTDDKETTCIGLT